MLIEIIDAETGQTLAYRDDLTFDRMVHAAYDRDAGRLKLSGLQSSIELLFDRQRQNLLRLDEPL
ncbi:MAG TPA: hypothetical protein EYP14_17585 [Planctomycetaceae bacterium]|nr:hypothetical protein [Planctomycetaceae bacterium]